MFCDKEGIYSCFSGTGTMKFNPVTKCVIVDAVYWRPCDISWYRRWWRELMRWIRCI